MVEGMPERIGRRDRVALSALALAGIGIPLWLSAAAGAIGLPTLDDWVYMRAADSLFRTGSVDLPLRSASAIGQIVMVQPLLWLSGGNSWAFIAFGLVMALIGLASAYLFARRFLGTGSAVLVVLLVEAFPGFARETASFMTDVPAFALATLCLLLGTRWLQGEGRRATLVASVGAGLLAVSIREFAIAAPAAILVAAWARARPDERVWLAGVSIIFAAGVAWVFGEASMSGRVAPGTPVDSFSFLGPAFVTLAAVVLPAAALGMGRRMATFSPNEIVIGAGLVLLVFFMPYGMLVGNIWKANGIGGDLLLSGSRDVVIGEFAWVLSGQLALFAAILVAALTLRWGQRNLAPVGSLSTVMTRAIRLGRSREAPLLLFLALYAGELVVYTQFGPILDRYLYPMAPAAAILLLRGRTLPFRLGRSQALSHAALAWLVASAFVIAANSFAYDVARYRAGEAAVAMGYDARIVDAGYEWVGYHASGAGKAGSGDYGLNWYEDYWSSFRPCAVLSNSLLDNGVLPLRLIRVNRSAYLQYLFFGPAEPLYLYGSIADGCPPPPAVTIAAP
jgi:4-amino-4-deoxy-L-arabinose transferase-like glycosyltransferase